MVKPSNLLKCKIKFLIFLDISFLYIYNKIYLFKVFKVTSKKKKIMK